MPVENQVAVIYAVTNGYLDEVEETDIRSWEHGFHEYLGSQGAEVLGRIWEEKVLSDDLEAALVEVVKAYNQEWAAGREGAAVVAAAS